MNTSNGWRSPGEFDPSEVDQRLFNNSVRKAMDVLAAFTTAPTPLTIHELAKTTGSDRSSVQRAVYTLHKLGYLTHDPATRRYSVSLRMMDLAFAYLRSDRLTEAALPHMAALTDRCGESVHLSRIDGWDILYLVRLPRGQHQYFAGLPGRRRPAFCTSGGRAILSQWDRDTARRYIEESPREPLTSFTVTDPVRLMQMIDEARDRGYATSDEEVLIGDCGLSIGLPIGRSGESAALHITYSRYVYDRPRALAELLPHLMAAGNAIRQALTTL
jgi:DNA-binding IclR family transcriptional regulator